MPYVADAFINADDPVYYNLAGVAINDPILGDGTLQQEGIVLQVLQWSRASAFTDAFQFPSYPTWTIGAISSS